MGHPTPRKDRIHEKGDTLTPELMDQLVQLTGPQERRVPRIGLKVTDWTVLDHTPDTPTVTLTCHQHTWWVTQWDQKGTATRLHTYTPEMRTATPLALGDRFRRSNNHTNHPVEHWLALKTAMHRTADAPASDTTLATTCLSLARKVAAYVRRHGMTQTQRWMSLPMDTEQIITSRTANLQTQANKMRGMHRPREGHRPAYSIFQGRNAPKPASQPAPEAVRPKPQPRPEGAGAPAPRAKRPEPAPKVAPPPPKPKSKPETCP